MPLRERDQRENAPSPSRKRPRPPRIQLKSKARRDSSTLTDLFTKARRQEERFKEDLARSDNIIADLRDKLDNEQAYSARVKKERDDLRDMNATLNENTEKLRSDAMLSNKEVQNWRVFHASYKKKNEETIAATTAEIADLKRIKNRERFNRDAEVIEDTTTNLQRGVEKALKKMYFELDKIFGASRILFDPECSSDDEPQKEKESEAAAPLSPQLQAAADIPAGSAEDGAAGGQSVDRDDSDSDKTEKR